MSIDENKKIALAALQNMAELKMDAMLDLLAEDCKWWVLGGTYFGDTVDKPTLAKSLKSLATGVPKGLNLSIKRVLAQDDWVVVEGEGNSPVAGNKVYNNHYCWLIRIRDGKICEGREYMDTLHVLNTFGPVMKRKGQ